MSILYPPANFTDYTHTKTTVKYPSLNVTPPLLYNGSTGSLTIASATENVHGVVTTTAQNIGGVKNFVDGIEVSSRTLSGTGIFTISSGNNLNIQTSNLLMNNGLQLATVMNNKVLHTFTGPIAPINVYIDWTKINEVVTATIYEFTSTGVIADAYFTMSSATPIPAQYIPVSTRRMNCIVRNSTVADDYLTGMIKIDNTGIMYIYRSPVKADYNFLISGGRAGVPTQSITYKSYIV